MGGRWLGVKVGFYFNGSGVLAFDLRLTKYLN